MLEENLHAFQIFLACATQWRFAPMGGLVGLDYTVVPFQMRLMRVRGVDLQADCMRRLQIIEAAALKELRRRSDHKARNT